ncbi:MAG: lytic transglycosylase domain-containing protein [Candidatus Competibacteraceae bacterium]|nr:lytic transglycosylase domain-containing protein [Candidatus Competibacteraceae bacterium]
MSDFFNPTSQSALTQGGRAITGHVPTPMPVTIPEPVPVKALSASQAARRAYFTPLINSVALSEGVDPALLHAVITQESGYKPGAASNKKAVGLMQLIPGTAQRFGLQPWERTDPAKNIRAGAQYLKWLIKRFNGSLVLAIAGYNAGEGAVQKYGNQIPPYRETQNYVRCVLAYYHRYQQRSRDQTLAMTNPAHRLERASGHPAEEPRDRMRDTSDIGQP